MGTTRKAFEQIEALEQGLKDAREEIARHVAGVRRSLEASDWCWTCEAHARGCVCLADDMKN